MTSESSPRLPGWIRECPAWFAILTGIVTVYGMQLIVAGSIASDAAATVPGKLPPLAYVVLAPWLHSSHMHLLQNAAIFGIFGY
jgi:hypothetical protein